MKRVAIVGALALGGFSSALARALRAEAYDAKIEACRVLDPVEPEVREAPNPKRGHERFRVEPRTTSMKMRSRR
jgi:hypothetical protein